jgi:hypothetical protein
MLPGGLTCIGTPQVGHGWVAGEVGVDLVTGASGTGRLGLLGAAASCASFDSGCSIRSCCSRIRSLIV